MFSALQAPLRPQLELPRGQEALARGKASRALCEGWQVPTERASTRPSGQQFKIHNQEVTATA